MFHKFRVKHTVCPCTGGVCVHVFAARSWMRWHFLHCYASRAKPSTAHSSYTVGSCGESKEQTISTATHYWKKAQTTQPNTHGPHHLLTCTRSRKKRSFMANSPSSVINSRETVSFVVGTARLPQMRLEFRVKEKDIIIMTVNQNEWMEGLHVLT